MPEMIINSLKIKFNDGETVLQAARASNIDIPTLCYHPGLEPFGGCRLCLVEVLAGGRPGLAASCTLPAEVNLVVQTDTMRVIQARRIIMGLLLARNPESKLLQSLVDKYGAKKIDQRPATNGCLLCGLCVRACRAVGKRVIDFSHRGGDRRVSVPFDKPPLDCIGCRACEQVCPVGLIKVVEEQGRVFIWPWQAEIRLIKCVKCGAVIGPEKQIHELKKYSSAGSFNNLCPACRRRLVASFCSNT